MPLTVGAADQLEGLREVRVALALALAGQLAGRPAEGLEERVLHLAVGDLGGPGALGQAVERRGRAGHGRDGVEQHLGGQELGEGVREVDGVVGVQLVGPGAELVGPADEDRADQRLEVEAALDEVGGQAVEQLVVGGGVGVAEVVDRLDDPPAHQVEPDAVDQALGEERVVGPGQPGGEPHAAVGGLGVVEAPGRPGPWASSPGRSGAGGPRRRAAAKIDLLVGQVALLLADPGEEGGEAVVVVLRPALERVVVALGALDADAEEELGGRLDRVLRVAADPVVVGRRVLEGRAVGREQLADELVHRHVPLEAASRSQRWKT